MVEALYSCRSSSSSGSGTGSGARCEVSRRGPCSRRSAVNPGRVNAQARKMAGALVKSFGAHGRANGGPPSSLFPVPTDCCRAHSSPHCVFLHELFLFWIARDTRIFTEYRIDPPWAVRTLLSHEHVPVAKKKNNSNPPSLKYSTDEFAASELKNLLRVYGMDWLTDLKEAALSILHLTPLTGVCWTARKKIISTMRQHNLLCHT